MGLMYRISSTYAPISNEKVLMVIITVSSGNPKCAEGSQGEVAAMDADRMGFLFDQAWRMELGAIADLGERLMHSVRVFVADSAKVERA
jgi:hypothetical protein